MEIIQIEIEKKKMSKPYFPDPDLIYQIKTDVNEWPYRRYFRGKKDSYTPHIWEREAGYSTVLTTINTNNKVNETLVGATCCFQLPCSTILPCKNNSQNQYLPNTNQCVFTSP